MIGTRIHSRLTLPAALLGALAVTGCLPAASPDGAAEPGPAGAIEIAAADGGAVRAYEFTGQVLLRVRAAPGEAPRSFTLNGISLSSSRALIAFDGDAEPPELRVLEGAVLIHDPVQAAPGTTLHGLAGMVVLEPGQRLLLVPGAPRIEALPDAPTSR